MTNKQSWPTRLIKVLSSLKLAVIIMLTLACLIAAGTIIESRYDAEAAKKTIYDTPYMLGILVALSVSLIAVMVDRWPWKKRHTPFILAHIGILFILLGGVLTMKYGVDGSVSVEIGRSSRYVVMPMDTDLLVYASYGGGSMTKLAEEQVDYFRHPPSPEHPTKFLTEQGYIEVTGYKKYVLPSRKVEAAAEDTAGPGVRFQIQNSRVNVVEWIVSRAKGQTGTHDFGPAQIHIGDTPEKGRGTNEIWLSLRPDGRLHWTLFRKESDKPAAKGDVTEGGVVQTGWMGLELRILRILPHARETWDFEEREAPTPLTTSALRLHFRDKDTWLLLDDTVRLFTDTTAYLVSYLHRRLDLGFDLKLDSFEMIPYEGTSKAKEYRSKVEFPGQPPQFISMNEPAQFQGLTFYQASFHNDNMGKPVASVFSVNYDPGRWFKYLGSLIMTLGVISLFRMRRYYWPKPEGDAPTKDASL